MKRKYTWSKAYGRKDSAKERIRAVTFDPPRSRAVRHIEKLSDRAVDTVHALGHCRPVWGSCRLPSGHSGSHDAYAKLQIKFTACGKSIKPKTDVSPTRRGVFYSTDPNKVTCALCQAKL